MRQMVYLKLKKYKFVDGLTGLIETFLTAMLNATYLNDETSSAKWVRGTC